MGKEATAARLDGEVNRVHRPKMLKVGTVNKVHPEPDPLRNAKESVGAAIKDAIGDASLKSYGTKGLMSDVVNGKRVPDYLARIHQNPDARRRLGIALLKGDDKVKVRRVVEIEED